MNGGDDEGDYRKALRLIGMPFLLVVGPLCGYYIGSLIDGLLGTTPYLTYLFLACGIAAAVREFYKVAKQHDK